MPKNSDTPKPNLIQIAINDDASQLVFEHGELTRNLTRLDADMKDEIAAVKAKYEKLAEPLTERRDLIEQSCEAWASRNRKELTDDGKRQFIKLAAGKLFWRKRPPSVTVRGKDAVIAALKAAGLSALIRVKEDIDKEAIAAKPETVEGFKGISIGSAGETFTVEAFTPEKLEGMK